MLIFILKDKDRSLFIPPIIVITKKCPRCQLRFPRKHHACTHCSHLNDSKVEELKLRYKEALKKVDKKELHISHVGLYENGGIGELFIRMAKEGSTISGMMDAFATGISIALQHGVPLRLLCDKFMHTRFEPSGFTNNESIPIASSLMDYIFRYLALKHLPTCLPIFIPITVTTACFSEVDPIYLSFHVVA